MPATKGPRGGITGRYIVMLALMALIVGMLALDYARHAAAPQTARPQPAIPQSAISQPAAPRPSAAAQPFVSPRPGTAFSICGPGRRVNCVVDGDTFWMEGEKIRILDIDTPELSPSRCAEEERLGRAAKQRLRELLNGGAVTLHRAGRDRDRYGRLLRRVQVNGQPVGAVLIGEGLARPYAGGRRSWCG